MNSRGRTDFSRSNEKGPKSPAMSTKPGQAQERQRWDSIRASFRDAWSKKFGTWPSEGGASWPGHHIRDLWHGGDPVDPNNIMPVEPGVHKVFTDQYPACYAGEAPWNTVGPDLPYSDK
jgi:hypothetical protein